MFTMYENALRREKEEKYDMATLLFYRLLEMIEQRRLMNYDIYISHPEYETVNYAKASNGLLDDVVKYSVNTVKKIVAANHSAENVDMKKKFTEVDTNLDDFQITSDAVRAVMVSCNLIRYLCQKAKTVHYLNHYERLSILYVFGHLG